MQQNDYTLKKEQIINEFDALIEFSNEHLSKPALDNELIEAFKKLTQKLINLKVSINEPFSIAVVGAQGVGKSTFINLLYNSLFDVGEIMPSTSYENEGIIIKIKKAPDETLLNKARLFNEKFVPIETYDKEEFLELINLENSEKIRENSKFKNTPFIEYYPDMKYIHVMRHGLDMAFSQNTQQLQNWHSLFNIKIPKEKNLIPVAQLEYWIRANERAILFAKKKLENRFLLLNFDDLCENPNKQVVRILKFLEIEKNNELLKKLEVMPKVPKTKNRYKMHNMNFFSDAQIEKVKKFGFKVNYQNNVK